ncbi:hypothetical protein DM02DRAFT_614690 [Periconia macrospinosa]|uniref:Mid2 domain-containing protein n=1 Tax=Periconia macrospinosa TaxID=97972 RepID=A0A2V1DRX4_9PLEO|nr:hypothetical protein DM02DRAFT_614690 [Periconia macrospinosa]
MRFFTLFLLPTVCILESVVAVESSLQRHPRDVVARATSSTGKPSPTSSRPTTSQASSTSRSSSQPTTSPSRSPTKSPNPPPNPTSSPTSPPSDTPSPSTTPTSSPTPSSPPPEPSPEPSGLSQSAKIGLGVGIPLAAFAIGGVVAAYVIGKRRGRKRRVSDPTAGAGKWIRDPSDELHFLTAAASPSSVAELPAAGDGGHDGAYAGEHQRSGSTWWKPDVGSDGGAQKYGQLATSSPPRTPLELPA